MVIFVQIDIAIPWCTMFRDIWLSGPPTLGQRRGRGGSMHQPRHIIRQTSWKSSFPSQSRIILAPQQPKHLRPASFRVIISPLFTTLFPLCLNHTFPTFHSLPVICIWYTEVALYWLYGLCGYPFDPWRSYLVLVGKSTRYYSVFLRLPSPNQHPQYVSTKKRRTSKGGGGCPAGRQYRSCFGWRRRWHSFDGSDVGWPHNQYYV